MAPYQTEFLQLAQQQGALRFGEFTLKSGRTSPYFFNAGMFRDGNALAQLGCCYAQAIVASGLDIDMVFGPAYKGIPLVSATAMALVTEHQRNYPWCFNRKEAKDHGEGGQLVGAPLQGRVAIIDDVMTAGTAVRESVALIEAEQATPAAVIIALDRQERGQGELSAVQEVKRDTGMTVVSIVTLGDVIEYLSNTGGETDLLSRMADYRSAYGI